jgi:hypothetical protein
MQEIVISRVAAVAGKFMHDRHADLYPGSNIYAVISIMKP